jgi:hypothetical protein
MTRPSCGVSQVQRAKDVSFVAFAVRADSKPNTNVAKLVCFTCLAREYAAACVLVGRTVGSRREISEKNPDLWRRGRDQGCDFDDGGAAVEMGKSCLLVSVLCVKDEC